MTSERYPALNKKINGWKVKEKLPGISIAVTYSHSAQSTIALLIISSEISENYQKNILRPIALLSINSVMLFLPVNFLKFSEKFLTAASPGYQQA